MARIRIAALNVENLFERPKAMAGQMQPGGNPILAAHARINALFQESTYAPPVKAEILQLLEVLGLTASDSASFAVLRQIRGRLVTRHRATVDEPASTEVVADGRGDWIGWVDLVKERVDELAMTHTARVIEDVDADIIAVVEAESRIALKRFAQAGVVTSDGDPAYPHVMVIDGNDDRGIDVGLMTKPSHAIVAVHPHVDDKDDGDRPIFGRDCPEYTVQLASGSRVVVLVNHFKSKGYGRQSDNDAKRRQQATRVAEIYSALRAKGENNVVVLGDLNDTPASDPLKPLLQDTDLRDIATHPSFSSDGRPGTYANGTESQKIDYVLLSPALYSHVTGGATFRQGVWGGKNGTLFPHYPTMTSSVHAASDHAAIYADVDID
jgi:endonuclease/exonuclease/phosphatase family metal-dependent hydrolase